MRVTGSQRVWYWVAGLHRLALRLLSCRGMQWGLAGMAALVFLRGLKRGLGCGEVGGQAGGACGQLDCEAGIGQFLWSATADATRCSTLVGHCKASVMLRVPRRNTRLLMGTMLTLSCPSTELHILLASRLSRLDEDVRRSEPCWMAQIMEGLSKARWTFLANQE